MDAACIDAASMHGEDACRGGHQAEHNSREKAKARKSGPVLLGKSKALANGARVLAVTVYWDPTHKCYRIAAHLPKGETVPDLNKLVCIGQDDGTHESSQHRNMN
jgi:hypothetical protein